MAIQSRWQSRPVFLTSTFRDMHAERDWLRNHVFPVLEERLRARRHHLETIDLRWGVDTSALDSASEQSREFQVLKVCLVEVDRSRPFLIGLIGDRYGWLPPADRMAAAAAEAGFDGPVAGKSVTELEIDFGVLSAGPENRHCLFYLRDPLPYDDMPPEIAAQYSEAHTPDPEAAAGARKLNALKARLKAALPDRVHHYHAAWDPDTNSVTGLEAWGEQVLEDLWREIDAETAPFVRAEEPSPFDVDRWDLEAFIEDRGRDFKGRTELLAALLGFATGAASDTPNMTCITGPPGAGKSALFATLHAELQDTPVLVLAHAAGISPNATQVDGMLRRWVAEMAAAVGQDDPLSDDSAPEDIDETFRSLLNRVSAERPVILLIDALNQFESTARAQHLTWLPQPWPEAVRLIATAIPGQQSEVLAKQENAVLRPLPGLSETEAAEIARAVCARYHRTISAEVLQALFERRREGGAMAAGNPLWLELAVEALNLLDAEDFARMDLDRSGTPEERLHRLLIETVAQMPAAVTDLYGWMLQRAEDLHGAAWARAFVSLIAISRTGWREMDLQSLMPALSGAPWDSLKFAALRRTFRAHVISRGTQAQWDFAHMQMRDAVRRRYLGDADAVRDIHAMAAAHLRALPADDPLRAGETLYHLIGADDRPGAANYYGGVLTDQEAAGAKSVLADFILADGETGNALSWVTSLLDEAHADDATRGWLCNRFNFDLVTALANRAGMDARLTIAQRTQSTMRALVARNADNRDWQRGLSISHETVGDTFRAMGDTPAALAAYRESRAVSAANAATGPQNAVWQNDLSACHDKIGDILIAHGDVSGALEAYRASLAIAETLTAKHPLSTDWRRNLAIGHGKIGDVLAANGDAAESLQSYRQSLSHREALAAENQTEMGLQRDLGVGYERFGIAQEATGDLTGALATQRAALELRQRLARQDPANAELQLDTSVSQRRLGRVFELQGDRPAAQQAYRDALEIGEALTALDSANVLWRRHLGATMIELGRVLTAAGAGEEAHGLLRRSLAINESLAAQFPDSPQWRHELSTAQIGIGDALKSLGEDANAAAAYRDALSIREGLNEENANNAEWQRGLLVAHARLGDILLKQQDRDGALAAHQASLAITLRLAASDPLNTGSQQDLLLSHVKVGDALSAKLDWPGALTEFRAAHAIAERLVEQDPSNSFWRNYLWSCFTKVGWTLRMHGDTADALANYRAQLSTSTRLAAMFPEQVEMLRQQQDSHTKIGECLSKQRDWDGAIASYSEVLAVIERINALEPDLAQLSRDQLTVYKTIGELAMEGGDPSTALAAYRDALTIGERLSVDLPQDTDSLQARLEILRKIGDLHAAQDDGVGASAAYREATLLAELVVDASRPLAALLSDLLLDHGNIGRVMQGEAIRLFESDQPDRAAALLEEAVDHFQLAVDAKNREDAPADWGQRQAALGGALLELGKRLDNSKWLFDAESAIRQGLTALSAEEDPHHVAACQHNLGDTLRQIGARDGDREMLLKSAEAFSEALQAFETLEDQALAERTRAALGSLQDMLEDRDS